MASPVLSLDVEADLDAAWTILQTRRGDPEFMPMATSYHCARATCLALAEVRDEILRANRRGNNHR